jgi:hypothetical protein
MSTKFPRKFILMHQFPDKPLTIKVTGNGAYTNYPSALAQRLPPARGTQRARRHHRLTQQWRGEQAARKIAFETPILRTPPPVVTPCWRRWLWSQPAAAAHRSGAQLGVAQPGHAAQDALR